jgi:hypothetical protein
MGKKIHAPPDYYLGSLAEWESLTRSQRQYHKNKPFRSRRCKEYTKSKMGGQIYPPPEHYPGTVSDWESLTKSQRKTFKRKTGVSRILAPPASYQGTTADWESFSHQKRYHLRHDGAEYRANRKARRDQKRTDPAFKATMAVVTAGYRKKYIAKDPEGHKARSLVHAATASEKRRTDPVERERARAYAKAYYINNAQKRADPAFKAAMALHKVEYRKKHIAKDPEGHKARSLVHAATVLEKRRTDPVERERARAYAKAWSDANPDKMRESQQRYKLKRNMIFYEMFGEGLGM